MEIKLYARLKSIQKPFSTVIVYAEIQAWGTRLPLKRRHFFNHKYNDDGCLISNYFLSLNSSSYRNDILAQRLKKFSVVSRFMHDG